MIKFTPIGASLTNRNTQRVDLNGKNALLSELTVKPWPKLLTWSFEPAECSYIVLYLHVYNSVDIVSVVMFS